MLVSMYVEPAHASHTCASSQMVQVRLDMAHPWVSKDTPQPILPLDVLIPSAAAGWLTSELDCSTTPEVRGTLQRGRGYQRRDVGKIGGGKK